MSLKDAYTMAHSAQCRLQTEANRPDRNLRFVVGHLMHYESLRLRIVEIEHDISKSQRAQAVQFRGTGHVGHHLNHKPSTGQLGRRSPPPQACGIFTEIDDDDDDDDDDDSPDDDMLIGNDDGDDDDDDELGLTRFPSGSARHPQHPQHPPPELEPDDPTQEEEDEDEEPVSPEEPDQATLQQALKGAGDDKMAQMYNRIKRCACHGKGEKPEFERMWELPGSEHDGKSLAVAEVVEEVGA